MFCMKCGTEYTGEACPNCGTSAPGSVQGEAQQNTQPQNGQQTGPQGNNGYGQQGAPNNWQQNGPQGNNGYGQQGAPNNWQQAGPQGNNGYGQQGAPNNWQQNGPQGNNGYGQQYYQNQPPYQQPNIVINNVNTNANANMGGGYMVSPKSKVVALLLCFFLGVLGVHRFYVGKGGTGVLYLFTGGLCGFGALIDFIMIVCGSFRDGMGLPLR